MATFHRLAIVNFGQKIEAHEGFSGADGTVKLDVSPATHNGESTNLLLVIASHRKRFKVKLNSERFLEVPVAFRTDCERAIENFANLVSIANSTSRNISSPDPTFALSDLSAGIQKLLSRCAGIPATNRHRASSDLTFDFTSANKLDALKDRMAGVAILSEAHSTSHATSRYRELIRFFELAFARPITDLRKILTAFLEDSSLGYSKDEIGEWVEFRHGANHADLKITTRLVFERDVLHIVDRMLQAAYDVLFNKVDWHSRDIERRLVFWPTVGTTNGGVTPFLTKGEPATINMALVDVFGTYPQYLGGLTTPPSDWWFPKHRSMEFKGALEVREAPRVDVHHGTDQPQGATGLTR